MKRHINSSKETGPLGLMPLALVAAALTLAAGPTARVAARTGILLCLLFLLALPGMAQAQDFTYTTTNGTITITEYTGPGGAVNIPDTITGLPVTSIGNGAFEGTNVTSVTIPNSVTSIGYLAFYWCSSLTSITVDASNFFYSSVDSVLFNKTQTMLIHYPAGKAGSSYKIPDTVTSIWDSAFDDCISLTSVTIPDSVTSIGDYAFSWCGNLTSVTIPNSVTHIGDSAFYSCVSLTSVTIPNSVTHIGDSAFHGCVSLTSVTIPPRILAIGNGAFSYCTNLTSITVDASNFFYSSVDGVLFNKTQTMLIQYPAGKAGSPYNIPDTVTNIGDGAFWYCTKLAGVTIPSSVVTIVDYAFSFCSSLTSVTIPNSVTHIGQQAFFGCTSLTSVYFQGNAPNYSNVWPLFGEDNKVTVYYLPGKTGWGRTFSERPALLWNPRLQTSSAAFGVRTNRFGFTITGTIAIPIVVEASTNLSSAGWTALQTCTLTNGLIFFSDPQWTNYPSRFYRLRSP